MAIEKNCLWHWVSASAEQSEKWIWGFDAAVCLNRLSSSSAIPVDLFSARGRSILIRTKSQISAALALVELDGIARKLVLCPPDLSAAQIQWVASAASINLIVCDQSVTDTRAFGIECVTLPPDSFTPIEHRPEASERTEWLLLTSGTTGSPKIVVHTLSTLTEAIAGRPSSGLSAVWSTFYDIRRYGGLQIFLRAMLGNGSMVLSDDGETTTAFLDRARTLGVTHISGTPSHWRRALMCRDVGKFSPSYVRLSGEIADQPVLDHLHQAFPQAGVAHAFASTEAGLAFEVTDGLAGFPADIVECKNDSVEMKVLDGTLRIKSRRTALRYIVDPPRSISDDDGFVDTNDLVELSGERYHFIGRRDGVINVGGLKVHPEEVEAAINLHPRVRMCRVKGRKNPVTGAVVTADVIAEIGEEDTPQNWDLLKMEIMKLCAARLPRHKIPAAIRLVPSLEIGPAGKLGR